MADNHTLDGTVHVSDAAEAEQKAREAATAYFGDRPYRLDITVHEQRTVGGQVLGYEVDYTAFADG